MFRIFLDSSVLFSAAYSVKGHSQDLILMGMQEKLRLFVSPFVLEETRRNLAISAPEKLTTLELILPLIHFEMVHPSKEHVLDAIVYVVLKDAPILAAAKLAEVDFFVTLDRKHLLGKPALEVYAKTKIVTPGDAFAFIIEHEQ